jgi:toxin-antitoxin system PIN domain toxin
VSAALLDVNVLVALLWPAHSSHIAAARWLASNQSRGWATCPFTQAAAIRIISNPAFSKDAFSVRHSIELLTRTTETEHHQFWPDDIPVPQALHPLASKIRGHNQITDAYLLALATHHNGTLVTFDRGLAAVANGARSRVHVLRQ